MGCSVISRIVFPPKNQSTKVHGFLFSQYQNLFYFQYINDNSYFLQRYIKSCHSKSESAKEFYVSQCPSYMYLTPTKVKRLQEAKQTKSEAEEPYSKVPFTFLTHPNFLVLFLTGNESHPSSLDSIKKHMRINITILRK